MGGVKAYDVHGKVDRHESAARKLTLKQSDKLCRTCAQKQRTNSKVSTSKKQNNPFVGTPEHKVLVSWKRKFDSNETGKMPKPDQFRKYAKAQNVKVSYSKMKQYLESFEALPVVDQYNAE